MMQVQSKRRGRPPLDARHVPTSTTLPPEVYDQLCIVARQMDVSVAALIRWSITRQLQCLKATGKGLA